MKPLLMAGEINVDLVFTGCGRLPEFGGEVLASGFRQGPGSSSMICAMGLARLGHSVAFAGVTGADGWGDYCIDAMRDAGIDVSAVTRDASLQTGITVALSSSHDRALVTYMGAIGALRDDMIADAQLAACGHLHVSSYYLQDALRPGLRALFKRARRAGLTVSLDPGFDPHQRWGRELVQLLPLVDVFLPNEREACAISGEADALASLHALRNGHTLTVVKLGSDGCMALQPDGRPLSAPAHAVDVLDSTGAGDSFDAGFLHAWRQGLPLRECLRWGSACGSLSTRGIGGTACQGSEADVRVLLGAAA
ncbi:carbohydrate kinase family protein [Dyella telluris]|uniref:Sugar kinase n=1 Tax=Dyella telluris TaxID=2763498 RepID=A0A7G8Q1H7_9GAMM|nr:sugar kinase [Dyella telluris]QNK00635.1 sugar kinase [Dyella telluris]